MPVLARDGFLSWQSSSGRNARAIQVRGQLIRLRFVADYVIESEVSRLFSETISRRSAIFLQYRLVRCDFKNLGTGCKWLSKSPFAHVMNALE